MVKHKYHVGDRVEYVRGSYDGDVTSGRYTITRLMPGDGSEPRYRVKSESEAHERSITESQLRSGADAGR